MVTKNQWKFNVNINKDLFLQRGYIGDRSEELFKIEQRILRTPMIYRIYDLNNKPIVGIVYELKSKTVKSNDHFKIQRVIETKK